VGGEEEAPNGHVQGQGKAPGDGDHEADAHEPVDDALGGGREGGMG